jgi:hypothetical protein
MSLDVDRRLPGDHARSSRTIRIAWQVSGHTSGHCAPVVPKLDMIFRVYIW